MKSGYENEKETISSDLEVLAELLNRHNLSNDTSSLYTASKLRYKDGDDWKYEIHLPITVNTIPSHIRPVNVEFIEIEFLMQIDGGFFDNNTIGNPINNLKFDVIINALSDEGKHLSTWHLDKHIQNDEDGTSKFIHPEYHFSYGGYRMWDNPLNYGDLLIHPSPRIPHPPMDAILGVDFILQNFINKKDIRSLINEPDYKRIVKNSQKRLWEPYMLTLAKHWCQFYGCPHFNTTFDDLHFKYNPFLIG